MKVTPFLFPIIQPLPSASNIVSAISVVVLAQHNTIAFRFFSIMSKRPAPPSPLQHSKTKTQKSLSAFFVGGGTSSKEPTMTSSTTPSSTLSSSEYRIFCDLDGVLVDFDAGVRNISGGRSPDDFPNSSMMWSAISRADRFYANLPWTTDGKALWDVLVTHSPTPYILTGVPRSNKSREEKFAWCKRELACDGLVINHVDLAGKKSTHVLVTGRRKDNKPGVVNVITCWSKNKHYESKRNHVLIDDRLALKDEKRGDCLFIIHPQNERWQCYKKRECSMGTKVLQHNKYIYHYSYTFHFISCLSI